MGMIGNSLAQGLVSGANIQDGTVDTADLKDAAVTPAKLSTGAPNWTSGGNFGVGIVPTSKMHIAGGAASGSGVINQNLRLSTLATGSSAFSNVGTGIQLDSWTNNNGSNPVAGIWSALSSGGSGGSATDHSGSLVFGTKNNADAAPVGRVYISPAGNFGVGAPSPTYLLDVWGFSASAGNQDVLRLYNQAGSTAAVSMVFHTGSNNVTAAIRNRTVSTHAAALVFETNNGSGLAERMLINSGGSVTMKDNLEVGNSGSSDTGLYVNFNTTSNDTYGRIRFKGGVGDVNSWTIHAFGSGWQTDFWTKSTGALNLTSLNGVTIGAWNDPTLAANNSGEVRVKTTLKVGGYGVLTASPGTENSFNQYTVMTGGTWYKIGALPESAGMYAISIHMNGGLNSGGDNIYWESAWGAVVGAIGGNVYNAAPAQQIAVTSMYHHRTVGEPAFWIDSGAEYGSNYGAQSIWVVFPQYTNVQGMSFFYKKLL